jgi:hypothetical protein
MTVAERTRAAVRDHPFLSDALAAGVVNYSAAASLLDIDAESDAVTAALRRYGDELARPTADHDARVTIERGLSVVTDADANSATDPLLRVAGTALTDDDGRLAAVIARGDVDAFALEQTLGRLRTAEIAVEIAGVGRDALVVVVQSRESAAAVRAVEDALDG